VLALALALAGCKPRAQLDIHYLPGFVPGSQNIFRPVRIAVPPTTGDFGSGITEVGAIYLADGTPQTPLVVADASRIFHDALIKGLADAGLMPVALDTSPADGKPPEGSDFILTSQLEELAANKRFGTDQTIHGQYFTMHSVMRVKYALTNRAGDVLYADDLSGIENEPPNPVGAEVFLPLETEPAESLSVALSRAVGLLLLQPKFRAIFPLRSIEASPTSTPTAQPLH
jgi:hypothetical protein